MLKTKEEIKKTILDYLSDLPNKTKQVEDYTLSRISEIVQADISRVEEAMGELESEDLVDSRKVQLGVYVPNTQEGFQVLTGFAKKRFITYSSFWAALFGFALLYIGFSVWGNYLSLPTGIATLFEAYLMGIRHGIFGSFVAGLIGGFFIQSLLGEFRRWQIVSEQDYKMISTLVKYTFYIFTALGLVYYVAANQLGYPIELIGIFALLGISITTAFSYERVKSRKKGD